MLDQDIKVTNVVEDARYDDKLERHPYIRVEFKVGTHGPFTERFDKDSYSALVRDDRLNAFAREVRTT